MGPSAMIDCITRGAPRARICCAGMKKSKREQKDESVSGDDLQKWIKKAGYLPFGSSVRKAYDLIGVEGFYTSCGDQYYNPHEAELVDVLGMALSAWDRSALLAKPEWEEGHPLQRVMDLACGSGEASLALLHWADYHPGAAEVLDAVDPFTFEAYEKRTGREALQWTFQDIAKGKVLEGRQTYDVVLCSFCLHLLEDAELFDLLAALAVSSRLLIIASPMPRPKVDPRTGWEFLDQVPTEWEIGSTRVAL